MFHTDANERLHMIDALTEYGRGLSLCKSHKSGEIGTTKAVHRNVGY